MLEAEDCCNRLSAEEMDEKRKEQIAYEYLCRLEEAKVWIEACIGEKISQTVDLEENLRNGVVLAKLGHFISPESVSLKKIYDRDLARYHARGLHFRHTDNINHWLRALRSIGFPEIFYPETTDVYDRKNIPRLMYCIHALSLYMFKIGRAVQIQDLYGKIHFTDEEITNMKKELDKYGITMPAFSKIGGILANEMPVDEAAMHAAIIAINNAIDKGDSGQTMESLKNPVAYLTGLDNEFGDEYQRLLLQAKLVKAENAKNKSFDTDNVPDVYDELLTQAEIQESISRVNVVCCLSLVGEMLRSRDAPGLLSALKRGELSLRNVRDSEAVMYLERLKDLKGGAGMLTREELQSGVDATNSALDRNLNFDRVMDELNEALDGEDPDATLGLLLDPILGLSSVFPDSKFLYHAELGSMKDEARRYLDHSAICEGVKILNVITKVNEAVDAGNSSELVEALLMEKANVDDVEASAAEEYLKNLAKIKQAKSKEFCKMLTLYDIQSGINYVNYKIGRIEALAKINELIDQDVPDVLNVLLQEAGISGARDEVAVHSQLLLRKAKKQKVQETGDPSAVLWYEEIQGVVDAANADLEEAEELSTNVATINMAVDDQDVGTLVDCLRHPTLHLKVVNAQIVGAYLECLKDLKLQKESEGGCGSGWMMNRLKNGSKFFFNVLSLEGCWSKEDHITKDFSLLTKDDIAGCVTEVNRSNARHSLFVAHEDFIVKLQAFVRGKLVRRKFLARKENLMSKSPAARAIQKWWRCVLRSREVDKRLMFFHDNQDLVIKAQSFVRGYLRRKEYLDRLRFLKEHEPAVIKIQSFMRSAWAKHDYKALMQGEDVPISVVKKFAHLLDVTDQDYSEEIERDKLKQQIVQEIRSNQKLEHDLTQMDIKIGLLVKNRISLQDVVSQSKFLRQSHSTSSMSSANSLNQGLNAPLGLKGLSKASHDKLEAYQHLFYLLQTQPNYLAKLMFELPQSKTTKFMESAVLSIFNYASNQRDEYMLVGLFKTALEEEIRSKVTSPSDIITGNPMVVKMIVSFNRNSRGQGMLRELLNPLVRSIIGEKDLHINTNVVEVYKQWVNQIEANTGKPSGLPYEVQMEQALKHEEVVKILNDTVSILQSSTEKFLAAILSSIDKIPYGIRYMAKVMRNALQERFPNCQEKEVLKIIGNLIYYRYINSAIVAPDAFDIIEVAASNGLTNEQRRNLGSVAKILQFAASNKGFGSDCPHLVSLNNYIIEAHSRFKRYFTEICEVEEPETQFNIDKYTEVARITKPLIYISVGEVVEMHKLLLEHRRVVAPEPNDPLHEILDDLGGVCDVGTILGDPNLDEISRAQMLKTEISLMLSNKFEVPVDDETNTQSLMLRTKQMIIDILRCKNSGESLMRVLSSEPSKDEESVYRALTKERERLDAGGARSNVIRQYSTSSGLTKMTLGTMKNVVVSNLRTLEQAGLVSASDGYQSIVNAIVKDVRNQRLHRQRRKVEMSKLKSALKSLLQKRVFFEEQINYYNQYVKTCLDNQATKTKKYRSSKSSVKYSASRLHEKGVLLGIDNLHENQFKNILFEISTTGDPGVFNVNAKFMGVNMEKVELRFQRLLELQYEGIAVMKMFDKAQVNVNLLIYLLNHKFYGKK